MTELHLVKTPELAHDCISRYEIPEKTSTTYKARKWSYLKVDESTSIIKKILYVACNVFIGLGNLFGMYKLFPGKVEIESPITKERELDDLRQTSVKDLALQAVSDPTMTVGHVRQGLDKNIEHNTLNKTTFQQSKEIEDEGIDTGFDEELDGTIDFINSINSEESSDRERVKEQLIKLDAELKELTKTANKLEDTSVFGMQPSDITKAKALGVFAGALEGLATISFSFNIPYISKLLSPSVTKYIPSEGVLRYLVGMIGFAPALQNLYSFFAKSSETSVVNIALSSMGYGGALISAKPIDGALAQTVRLATRKVFSTVTSFSGKSLLHVTTSPKTDEEKQMLEKVHKTYQQSISGLISTGVLTLSLGKLLISLYMSGYLLPLAASVAGGAGVFKAVGSCQRSKEKNEKLDEQSELEVVTA